MCVCVCVCVCVVWISISTGCTGRTNFLEAFLKFSCPSHITTNLRLSWSPLGTVTRPCLFPIMGTDTAGFSRPGDTLSFWWSKCKVSFYGKYSWTLFPCKGMTSISDRGRVILPPPQQSNVHQKALQKWLNLSFNPVQGLLQFLFDSVVLYTLFIIRNIFDLARAPCFLRFWRFVGQKCT